MGDGGWVWRRVEELGSKSKGRSTGKGRGSGDERVTGLWAVLWPMERGQAKGRSRIARS